MRRKKGCVVHHFYKAGDAGGWLVYSEWQSLNELGGARRELARSPLYRKLHALLERSGERAFEPYGGTRSLRGAAMTSSPAALLVEMKADPEKAEIALDALKQIEGYASHVVMRQVGQTDVVAGFVTFASEEAAAKVKKEVAKAEGVSTVDQLSS